MKTRRSAQIEPSDSEGAGGQSSSMNLRSSKHIEKAMATQNLEPVSEASVGERLPSRSLAVGNLSSAQTMTRSKKFGGFGLTAPLESTKEERKVDIAGEEEGADGGHVIENDDEDDHKTLDWLLGKPLQSKRKVPILSSKYGVGLQGKQLEKEKVEDYFSLQSLDPHKLNAKKELKDQTSYFDDKQDNMTLDCLLGIPFRRKGRALLHEAQQKEKLLRRKVHQNLINQIDDKQDDITLDCLFGKSFRRKVKTPISQQILQKNMVGQDQAENRLALGPVGFNKTLVNDLGKQSRQKISPEDQEAEDSFYQVFDMEKATLPNDEIENFVIHNDEAEDFVKHNIDNKCVASGEYFFIGNVTKVGFPSKVTEILPEAVIDNVFDEEKATTQIVDANDPTRDNIASRCADLEECTLLRGDNVDAFSQVIETQPVALIDGVANKQFAIQNDEAKDCIKGSTDRYVALIDGVVNKQRAIQNDEAKDCIKGSTDKEYVASGESLFDVNAHKVEVSSEGAGALSVAGVIAGVVEKGEATTCKDEAEDSVKDNADLKYSPSEERFSVGEFHMVNSLNQAIETPSAAIIYDVAKKEEAITRDYEANCSVKDNIDMKNVASNEFFVGGVRKVDASSQGIETWSMAVIDAVHITEEATSDHEAVDPINGNIDMECVASGECCFDVCSHKVDVPCEEVETQSAAVVNGEEAEILYDEAETFIKDDIDSICVASGECSFIGDVHMVDAINPYIKTLSAVMVDGVLNEEEPSTKNDEADDPIKGDIARNSIDFGECSFVDAHKVKVSSQGIQSLSVEVLPDGRKSREPNQVYARKKKPKERVVAKAVLPVDINGASISEICRKEDIQSSGGSKKNDDQTETFKSTIQTETLDQQATLQRVQKRKHKDLAHEANLELNAFIGAAKKVRDCSQKGVAKSQAQWVSSSQAAAGEAAAIAAGLKARALTPFEKILFKDMLKRRGGVQEYLECRNMVLRLWERDAKHILSILDCGVDFATTRGESSRAALIREVYNFLNLHGYINIGLVKNKLKSSTDEEVKPCPRTTRTGQTCAAVLKQAFGSVCEPAGSQCELNCVDLNRAKVVEGIVEHAAVHQVAAMLPQVGEAEHTCVSRTSSELSQLSDDKPLASLKQCIGFARPGSRRKRELEEKDVSKSSKKGSAVGANLAAAANAVTNKGLKSIRGSNFLLDGPKSDPLSSEASDVKQYSHQIQNPVLDDVCVSSSISLSNYEAQNLETINLETEVKVETNEKQVIVQSRSDLYPSYESEVPHEESGIKLGASFLDSPEVQENVCTYERMAVSQNSTFPNGNDKHRHVIIVGAGPAGLIAARHLQRMNFKVTVLEARERTGGRVCTDWNTFSVPVDLGASIITGVEADIAAERRADPSALLCRQHGLELTTLRGDCPLFDSVTGSKVPEVLDTALEAEFNSLLDDTVALVAQAGDAAMCLSLEEGLEQALKKRQSLQGNLFGKPEINLSTNIISPFETVTHNAERTSCEDTLKSSDLVSLDGVAKSINAKLNYQLNDSLSKREKKSKISLALHADSEEVSQLDRRIMDWHFANLEYGCAAELKQVSLPFWNQDDVYGGFGGPHCMIKEGYGTLTRSLAEGLNIQLGKVVTEIRYTSLESRKSEEFKREVKVKTKTGEEYVGDVVLVTVPLGCLKADTIKFVPSLPSWKMASIKKLGFGVLNKVVLEFANVFWDETVDYFGATAENTESRGRCFMFWNLKRMVGAPVLVALVVGKAALEGEQEKSSEQVGHALRILRKLYGEKTVPEPIASTTTRWGSDQYSRGAYSYVAVGASGEDYDVIGRPIEDCLFFAGEATCKEYPDTVGGAMLSGIREAVGIIDILENEGALTKAAENLEVEQGQSESERDEVRNMMKRLSAADLSNVLLVDAGDLESKPKPISRADLLKDMFGDAKTTAARIFLAKEMFQLPISVLRNFAGTKAGLTVLNSWILDSMGKNGTQLLRFCVRLLLLVATDLVSVRQTGIGRIVKEKLWLHTSRDVRAIAGQLVKMWVEIFQREKTKKRSSSLSIKEVANSAVPNLKSTSECKAKKNTKNPLQNNCHSEIQPKTSITVKLSSTVGSSIFNNNLGKQAITMVDELRNSQTLLDSSKIQGKGVEDFVGEKMASKVETDPLVAAKVAKAAAEACAAVEGPSNSLPVLPEIIPFHKFVRREKPSVKVAVVDWKNRIRPDIRSPCFSSLSSGKALTALHVGLQKVNEWSLDLTGTCGNFDSLEDGGFGFYEDYVSPTNTPSTSKMEEIDNEQRTLQLQDSESGHVACVKAESSFKDLTNDLSLVRDKASLRDSLDEECEDRSICGPETVVDHRNSALESSSLQGQQSMATLNLPPDEKIEAVDKAQKDTEKRLGLKPVRTSEDIIGLEKIKRAVSDYVANLLAPLYKTRKIQRDDFKLIVKKTVAKVMERDAPQGAIPDVSVFLNSRRKTKIRALVDRYIEMQMSPPQSRDGLSTAS